jgi:hypothetical protein
MRVFCNKLRLYRQAAKRGHDISEVVVTSESLTFASNSGNADSSGLLIQQ